MKARLVVFASLALALLSGKPATAQTLYLISAAATMDPTLDLGASASRTAMLSTMSMIANVLHLKFNNSSNIQDENFNCTNIRNAVRSLSAGGTDIVVFYYAGHGARGANDVSPLPTLACGGAAAGLPLQEVIHDLSRKSARLTLVVADACNYHLEIPQRLSVAALAAQQATAYPRLFMETAGLIVLDSSSPGEFSWYTVQGGRFTEQFIATLKNPPGGSTAATWDTFVSKVTEPMVITPPADVIVPGLPQPVLKAGQTVLESPQALLRLTAVPK